MSRSKHSDHYDLYDDVEKIKSALVDTVHDVRGKADEMLNDSVESVRERTSLVKNNVADYTAKKPFQTIGIAVAIGFIAGYFIRK